MGMYPDTRRIQIPTSHRNPGDGMALRVMPNNSIHEERKRDRQKEKQRRRLVELRLKELKDLRVPRDGIVRAVASEAEKCPPSFKEIVNFRKIVRIYCELWIGYKGRHVVQEYLYIRLKRMLEQKKLEARETAIEIIREDGARPQVCDMRLSFALKPLERKDLERLVVLAYREIQMELLALAKAGKPIPGESGHRPAYEPRLARIGNTERRTCFLIVKTSKDKLSFKVVALATEAEFRRFKGRNHLNRRTKRRFHNRPPIVLNHS